MKNEATRDALPVYSVAMCRFPPDWAEVEAVRLPYSLWKGKAPETLAAMVYDPEEGFRVRMTCRETSPQAVYAQQDDPVWEDSCLEAFLNFAPEAGSAYLNLEVNARGAMRCEFGARRGARTRLTVLGVVRPTVCIREEKTYWQAEFFVPLATVKALFGRESFAPGDVLRGNFYKCGDRTAQPHYGAWAPIDYETPLFHLPACFGTLVIGAADGGKQESEGCGDGTSCAAI